MSTTIDTRLSSLATRVRRLLWLRGLCTTLTVFVGLVAMAAWLDWALHLDDVGLRLLILVGILVTTAWMLWRTLLAPLRRPPAAGDLAMRLEERFPELRDGLASVVQFVGSGFTQGVGSPAMQRLTEIRTEKLLASLPLEEVIEPAPVRRIAWGAVVICGAAALLMGLNQSATWLALRRLALPFAAPAWPRSVNLRVLTTEWQPLESSPDDIPRIALGEEYRVYIENQTGRLPQRVMLETRTEAGAAPSREPLRVVSLRDGEGQLRDVAAVTLRANTPGIWFRAVAGDDEEMPWYEVHAVPVPQLEAIRIRVIPPTYMRLLPRELPEGLGDIEAWIGSRIELWGRSSRPLKSAAIRLKTGEPVGATVNADPREFQASWQANEVGVSTYAVELKDVEGFEPGRVPRFELRVRADTAPEVSMERPATDLQVTPTATVTIEYLARDDLGLSRCDAVWKKGDASREADATAGAAELRIPLWRPGKSKPVERDGPPDNASPTGDTTVQGTWDWDLTPLQLQPGQVISLTLEAADSAHPEHIGRSVTRMLRVVSPEQKTQELAARQAELLEQIERAEKQQALAREQTRELEIQASEVGGLRPEDVSALERLEATQRQIAAQLAGQPGSLDRRLAEAVAEFRTNQLGDDASVGRLERMANEVSRLTTKSLPGVERALTRARKEGEAAPDSNPAAVKGKDPTDSSSHPGRTVPREPTGDDQNSSPDSPTPAKSSSEKPPEKTPETEQADGKANTAEPVPPEPRRSSPPVDGEVTPAGNSVTESLREAIQQQSDVGDTLHQLGRQLARWRDEQEASEQLGQLAADQKAVSESTEKLAESLVGKPRTDLTPQERADLEKLVDRQRQLGEREDTLELQLEHAAARLERDDPDGAAQLREQLNTLRSVGLSERFREAAERLRENKTAAARAAQKSIEESLARIAQGESASESDPLEQLVKEQRELEDRIDALREREETLQKRMEAARQIEDAGARADELQKLGAEQETLRQELEQAARQLRRLAKNNAADRLANVARRLEQQRKKLAAGDLDAAAEEQAEVLEQLTKARKELQQEREEGEEQLAFEQLTRLRDKLEGLKVRQEAALKELERLSGLVPPGSNWTRPALASLRSLGTTENLLADETQALAPQVDAAKVFSLALEQSAAQLRRVAELLAQRNVGEETRLLSMRVSDRFRELLKLIADRQAGENGGAGGGANPPEGQDAGGGGDAPVEDVVSLLAEFRLLRSLQQDVADRTAALRALEPSDGTKGQLESLAGEQARLADLARDLMTKLKTVVEDDRDEQEAAMESGDDAPRNGENQPTSRDPRPPQGDDDQKEGK